MSVAGLNRGTMTMILRFCSDCCRERTNTSWSDYFRTRLCPDCYDERCEKEDERACTCRTPIAHSADIDPPEYKSIRDPWCPVHGKDPDEEYEKMRDRERDR